MKKIIFLSAVLTLLLLVPASITWAQSISSQKGLTSVIFNLKEGTVKVYLPDDIRPGDQISGSIAAEAVGKNAKQQAANLAILRHYSIGIFNSIIAVENAGKPLQLSVRPGKPVPCRVELIDAAGQLANVKAIPTIPENEVIETTGSCNIPTHALTAAPMRINGAFDGDASNTRCMLNNNPLQVLAESPRQCIISFPDVPAGTHALSLQEAGKPACTKNISAVDMNITADKMNLVKGEKTYVDVKITGLQGLPDTARLTVTNTSANIITMDGGNNSIVSIPPSTDNSNMTYTRRFMVQSINNGSFTINLNLGLPEPGLAGNTAPQAYFDMKVWLPLKGGDLTASYENQPDEAKMNGGENIYVIENVIRIFYNGLFMQEFDLPNTGSGTVQDLLNEYLKKGYPVPYTNCDSISFYCKKHAALNVFWGNVFSVFKGSATSGTIEGEPIEKSTQNSLLITRGWQIDCCTGAFQLKLFFHAMKGGGGPGSYNVTFTKIIDQGKICKVDCPECVKKCAQER